MNFEQWAENYFGKNVSYPEACRDAWNAAVKECARIAELEGVGEYPCCSGVAAEIASVIRMRRL